MFDERIKVQESGMSDWSGSIWQSLAAIHVAQIKTLRDIPGIVQIAYLSMKLISRPKGLQRTSLK